MNRRIVATTPGKLILMGEHAAVYGQPALVAAVDPRARVEVAVGTDGLHVELEDLGRTLDTSWAEVEERAKQSSEAWQAYAADPTPERFAAVGSGSPLDLVQIALGEVASRVETANRRPLEIRVTSRLPVGSGFGSSASIAVALVGGILTLLEDSADPRTIDKLVLEVERRQHGLPSGIDQLTVLHGGVLAVRRTAGGRLEAQPLVMRRSHLEGLQVYQTGQPAETTGEVVAAVRRLHDRDGEGIQVLLERMGRNVLRFQELLEQESFDEVRTAGLFRDYHSCLVQLGVVPAAVVEAIREVELLGGAAKISGAGALSGAAAGCLLVLWPGETRHVSPARLREYERLDIRLGAGGFRVEDRQ